MPRNSVATCAIAIASEGPAAVSAHARSAHAALEVMPANATAVSRVRVFMQASLRGIARDGIEFIRLGPAPGDTARRVPEQTLQRTHARAPAEFVRHTP